MMHVLGTIGQVVLGIIFLLVMFHAAFSKNTHPKRRAGVGPPDAYIEGSKPTATRVLTGAVLLGPIGALAGFAFRKKTKNAIYINKDR